MSPAEYRSGIVEHIDPSRIEQRIALERPRLPVPGALVAFLAVVGFGLGAYACIAWWTA